MINHQSRIEDLQLSNADRLFSQLHRFLGVRPVCVALTFLLIFAFSSRAATIRQPIHTQSGAVMGVQGALPGITVFKGIPYAAPPVGELRWKPTQPPADWHGVLKADHFGANCPQSITNERKPWTTEFMAHGETSENCLFLNIWTPAKSAAAKLPVLVWAHGGAYTEGSGAVPAYDGEGLASKGIVVVTINYRLGIFGFLAHPELSSESEHHSSGNYGLLDQVAALNWVVRNIAAFGGDPSRVTFAGQSAGAGSVHLLSISPLARGLFQRAIAESGSRAFTDPGVPRSPMALKKLADAEQEGLRFAEDLGAKTLKQLRAMTWEQLSAKKSPLMRPVLDGWVIPEGYADAYAHGSLNDVPFLTGCNADEDGAEPHPNITLEEFHTRAQQRFGALADEFLQLYPAATDAEAAAAQNEAARDYTRTTMYLWAIARLQSGRAKVFTYFWNHPLPGPDQEKYGAFHTSEVPYVFNSLNRSDRPFNAQDKAIADRITSYWANFAANGDPNGKGLPEWPAVSAVNAQTMELGDSTIPIPVAQKQRYEFLRRFIAPQPNN